MNPPQPQPQDLRPKTAEFEAIQTERPTRDSQTAQGRPSWTPDEGDFS